MLFMPPAICTYFVLNTYIFVKIFQMLGIILKV